ncbi:S1/P1 nuclease [Catenaria anguillulae PL171]|uniref:S1/P1 nuclease n=1 Tax=Catenaria anguillulae PL171 TaxID=765915 RepID=A0A1Y2HRM2_9FUNG|nr:S1/P1 nuclease [Catenaria anguillulae PL171]
MSVKILSALSLLALIAAVAQPAEAWGREGHRAAATIAYGQLTPKAKAAVDALVPSMGTDFVSLSTWADDIRSQRRNTGGWHFVNAEDDPLNGKCGILNYPADCPADGCVVAAIAKAAWPLPNIDIKMKAEALAFILHFVGDVSQPLHASKYGRGSNDVKVIFDNDTKANLHAVWDGHIIRKTIATEYGNDWNAWVNGLLALPVKAEELVGVTCAKNVKGSNIDLVSACAVEWANDSEKHVCLSVYQPGFQPNTQLGGAYYDAVKRAVDTQVLKAGMRLGAFLNALFA